MGIFGKLFARVTPRRGSLAPAPKASMRMQAVWRSLPESKKIQLRRVLRDSDRDGVPDRFDCQPYNPFKQDSSDEEIIGSVFKEPEKSSVVDRFLGGPKLEEREQANYEGMSGGLADVNRQFEKVPQNFHGAAYVDTPGQMVQRVVDDARYYSGTAKKR